MSTYVMSDIHGQEGLFRGILDIINFSKNDELYILGDVIDRGPSSIELLVYIMQQDNIHMLLGNHELMMLDCLLNKRGNFLDMINSCKTDLWISNGGKTTLSGLMNYTKIMQDKILSYISGLPVVIPRLSIKAQNYYLAHAHHGTEWHKENKFLSDLSETEADDILWNREYSDLVFPADIPKNTTVIFGHTPVHHMLLFRERKIWKHPDGHFVNIDCGCADRENPMLGCLRLDDMQEFYIQQEDALRIC